MSPAARHARRPTGQAHTSPTAAALAPALRFMRPPRQEARARPRRESAARAVTARRVLIVDDDAALRTLYRFNLEASGLMVDEAPDGKTALRMLAEGELPDALLLDVMMPGIDGWTVAERLAADERTAKLPILFVTARAEDASRTRGAALGAAAYLTKPFNPVSLADEIERAIAESGRRG